MKQFVMYGAGSIGRGFIGALFSKLGYEVTFIDVNEEVVRLLNTYHQYDQVIVGEQTQTITIQHVKAVDGKDEQAVCEAIASADLMATALGANILPKVAPLVAKGLKYRWETRGNVPLDILICENLNDADRIFHDAVAQYMEDPKWDTLVGFVETSIGKMVPPANNFEEATSPLAVRQEAYEFLPVNKAAIKTKWTDASQIIPYAPFQYFVERKLFVHNMAHFTTALLGMYEKFTYISEAASDISIQWIVKNCMAESAMALAGAYGVSYAKLQDHMNDLLYRFQNVALKDTVARVARDPMRKIKPKDRLVGAMRLCLENEIQPVYLCFAISLALSYVDQDVLEEVCEIHQDEKVYEWIQGDLAWLKKKPSLTQTITYLEKQEHEIIGSVI